MFLRRGKCTLGCESGFAPTSGSNMEVTCEAGASLSVNLASARCTPVACTLPPSFGTDVVATGSCAPGSLLARGSTCQVACAAPTTDQGGNGVNAYACSVDGELTAIPYLNCV